MVTLSLEMATARESVSYRVAHSPHLMVWSQILLLALLAVALSSVVLLVGEMMEKTQLMKMRVLALLKAVSPLATVWSRTLEILALVLAIVTVAAYSRILG